VYRNVFVCPPTTASMWGALAIRISTSYPACPRAIKILIPLSCNNFASRVTASTSSSKIRRPGFETSLNFQNHCLFFNLPYQYYLRSTYCECSYRGFCSSITNNPNIPTSSLNNNGFSKLPGHIWLFGSINVAGHDWEFCGVQKGQ